MLQWASVAASPRRDDGRWRPGARTIPDGLWPFYVRSYRPLLAIGRSRPGLGAFGDDDLTAALAEEYQIKIKGWDCLSRTQKLDVIATKILARDRDANVSKAHSDRRDYHSASQAAERANREKPFPEMDALVAMTLQERHLRWSRGWFRMYGNRRDFEIVGLPAAGATVYR